MSTYKSDAYQEGWNARRRKQKKNNTYMSGSSGYAEYERGWDDHRSGKLYAASPTLPAVPVAPKKIPKTYVGFCMDRSGSMSHLTRASTKALNDQLAQLKGKLDQNILVSLNSFGGDIRNHFTNAPVYSVYEQSGFNASGQTPLFDAVGKMITDLKCVPDFNDKDVAFMVVVVTDGYENASHVWTSYTVNEQISNLQSTDRWTFVFLVPPNSKKEFVRQFGVPEQNVMEWEATQKGVEQYSQVTMRSMDTYFTDRTKGITSTKTFYTDLAGVRTTEIKAKLRDISNEIKLFDVNVVMKIRPFVEKNLGKTMLKGAAFYQLVKTEKKVQDYKQIIIRDKKTRSVYSGTEARNLLGLPHNGTVKIVPGNHGQYDIFVQSTSVNRKLPVGTQVIYWENAGQPFTTSY